MIRGCGKVNSPAQSLLRFGFPPRAAEFAGITFARSLRANPDALNKLAGKVPFPALLPDAAGLRDGLSIDRFEDDYGDASDDRFQRVLADIRGRVKKLRPRPGRARRTAHGVCRLL